MTDGLQSRSPLRIAVDGYHLGMVKGTGLASYSLDLTRTLRAMGTEIHPVYGGRSASSSESPEIAFFDTFRPRPGRRPWIKGIGLARMLAHVAASVVGKATHAQCIDRVTAVDIRPLKNLLPEWDAIHFVPWSYQEALRMNRLFGCVYQVALRKPVDIFHSTFPVPVTVKGAAAVTTIADLIPFRMPFVTLDHKPVLLRLIKQAAARSRAICAISEATRKDVLSFLPIAPEKVFVTYPAVEFPQELLDVPEGEIARFLKLMYRLDAGRYLLFVSALEPRKNLPRLLDAYLGADVNIPLVVVGKEQWRDEGLKRVEAIFAESGQAGAGQSIIRIPYTPRSHLVHLYRGARALVFPSLAEGFGLPPVEAMALGCPTVVSRIPCLEEVCGDAADYFDPYDVRSIREAITAVVHDDGRAEELREKGRKNAARFTHQKSGEQLAAAYRFALRPDSQQ